MLSLTKLANAEYLITQVAVGVDEYYTGGGEAPGVWQGRWAAALGLDGIVDHDHLRALLEGQDPMSGRDLLAGRPLREVRAFDATFSAPKSVSLLWAFGSPEVAATVAIAHVEAVTAALDVLQDQAAVARQQRHGVRRIVPTGGLAVATFMHRTSREGDPQLHTHCVIPNLVQRADGSCVALEGHGMYEWKKAVGSIYAEELRTRLTNTLGVGWGPDRNGTREMTGLDPTHLRVFSKRTVAIEEHLAALAVDQADRAAVMRADETASMATRPAKDRTLTPDRLRAAWDDEAAEAGLPVGDRLLAGVRADRAAQQLTEDIVFAQLVDPDGGLCVRRARFGHAQVVEAVAALGAGTLDAGRILELSTAFLGSDLVVRLIEPAADGQPSIRACWSTRAHLAMERQVLERIDQLIGRHVVGAEPQHVNSAIEREGRLGNDQANAVRALNAAGPAVRLLTAPAGYGKTTSVHAAAVAQMASGRRILGLATTNQAAAELRQVGLPASTLARFRLEVERDGLAPDTTLVLDEISQVATSDAAWLLDLAVAVPGTQLWCLGDARQGRPVRAGGLAAELERLAAESRLPAAMLTENRRQLEPAERAALTQYRAGQVADSQAIRADAGWEHDHGTPDATRQALAEAVIADGDRFGPAKVAVLTVSHADAEDLADRIRDLRARRGELTGPTLTGPGWNSRTRTYAAGDVVLVHANVKTPGVRLHNGTVLTVSAVTESGLAVTDRSGHGLMLPVAFVQGHSRDGHPNLSHAWARTVDGAQGGTWQQVHLLGTAALDHYRGYVGQSRGRQATHTWNVTRPDTGDHGGIIVEPDPAEQVLAALLRQPDNTFAAHDDPHLLDRDLSAERAAHAAIIAARPPDVSHLLQAAIDRQRRTAAEHAAAAAGLAQAEQAINSVGPLARLRRPGRQQLARAERRAVWARERQARADNEARAAASHHDALQQTVAARAAWQAEHGWRVERVADIDTQLARHWADAVLTAIRQGDPLAYGLDRLRHARHTTIEAARALDAGLPPDRADALARASAHLRDGLSQLSNADAQLVEAQRQARQAGQRRWGRIDKPALAVAQQHLAEHEQDRQQAEHRVAEARSRVAREAEAIAARAEAVQSTREERQVLADAIRALTVALDEVSPAAAGPSLFERVRDTTSPLRPGLEDPTWTQATLKAAGPGRPARVVEHPGLDIEL